MKIIGYLKTSLIEWPGKISSVIFTPGCNFHCSFCHNADLVDPKRASRLTSIPEEQIFTDLEKRKKWVDGIVITGGEPTLQEDLPKFLKKCHELGLKTMLETNGSKPEVIAKLLNCHIVDFVAMDIKGLLDYRYSRIANCKMQIEKIRKTIKLIFNSGLDFEFRTTVVPGLHGKETLLKMAEQLRKELSSHQAAKPSSCRWFLQTFQPKNCLDPKFEKIKPYSKMEMKRFLVAVRKVIGGVELR